MSEREARVTQPTTEAGRALLEFAANIRPFGEDYPVLSPGSIERLTPLVVAVEREALADRPPEPHPPHRYRLIPVWLKDGSEVESWWWCTDHPAGQWVKIEDDPDAAEAIPSWRADRPPEPPTLDVERLSAALFSTSGMLPCLDAMDGKHRCRVHAALWPAFSGPFCTARLDRIAAEYNALGASPPPPDLSERWLRLYDTVKLMRFTVGHDHTPPWPCPVYLVDEAMRAVAEHVDPTYEREYTGDLEARYRAHFAEGRAALASQPPSTPREP